MSGKSRQFRPAIAHGVHLSTIERRLGMYQGDYAAQALVEAPCAEILFVRPKMQALARAIHRNVIGDCRDELTAQAFAL